MNQIGILDKIRMKKQIKKAKSKQAELEEYYKTDRWKELRQERLELDDYKCRLCAKKAEEVHHREYPDVLGEETVEDLTSLCCDCHTNYHNPPSISDLREQLRESVVVRGEKEKCKLCNQNVEVMKRNIGARPAALLIWMHDHCEEGEYIHITRDPPHDYTVTGGAYGVLAFHGFIEKKPNPLEPGKFEAGMWTITEAGRAFATRSRRAPKYANTFLGELISFSVETVDIADCLGKRYDYHAIRKDKATPNVDLKDANGQGMLF